MNTDSIFKNIKLISALTKYGKRSKKPNWAYSSFQIQIQNSLLLAIYIVLIIYNDMDTMYMYFLSTISYTLCI